jgi:REP element-mobilizing transposase RayT
MLAYVLNKQGEALMPCPMASARQLLKLGKGKVVSRESTISIWRLFPKELLKEFWKEHTFWTDGYFVSSIGEVSSQSLKRYFQNQG